MKRLYVIAGLVLLAVGFKVFAGPLSASQGHQYPKWQESCDEIVVI